MSISRSATVAWVLIHLGPAIFPFLLEGGLRLTIANGILTFDTFRASTFAMSIGLIALFVNQSLRTVIGSLVDKTEATDLASASSAFNWIAVGAFVLFGALVTFHSLANDCHLPFIAQYRVFQVLAFGSGPPVLMAAIVTQRSFKLKAAI